MFQQTKAALDIWRSMPDAVGYDDGPATHFTLPDELLAPLPEGPDRALKGVVVKHITLFNETYHTQRDVRLVFSGEWSPAYSPRLVFEKRDTDVRYTLKAGEFLIEEIPPHESVVVHVFNPLKDFSVRQVLVGDQEITPTMQRLAEARRYPELARAKLWMMGTYVALAVLAIILVTTVYQQYGHYADQRRIEQANLGLEGCTPYVFHNAPGKEKQIERQYASLVPYFESYLLRINDVANVADLMRKPTPILCRQGPED